MSEIEQPQTSDVLLLNLINTDNESTIEREQIDFGLPNTLAEPIEGSDANTRTEVIAVPDAPWNKSVKVDYHRRELPRYFNGGIEVAVPKGASKEDVVSRINAEYGTKLAHLEMEISPAITAENIPGEFVLKAVANSLGYIGEVPLSLDLTRAPLSDRLTKSDLDGFGYPNANTPSLNNVVYTPDAKITDQAGWPGTLGLYGLATDDNRLAYDIARNGEVEAFVRVHETRGTYEKRWGFGGSPDANGDRTCRTTTASHSNFGMGFPWMVAFGFHLTEEQSKFQEILEGYDIEVIFETKTSKAATTSSVVESVVKPTPGNPAILQLFNKAGDVAMGAWQMTNTGGGKTTWKAVSGKSPGSGSGAAGQFAFPGLTKFTRRVNGTDIDIYTGYLIVTLRITRKVGRAKVIEIVSKANLTA